jgi:hypothetical protein
MAEGPPRLGIAYFGNRYPHHARADLEGIAAAGADFVVHVMSEADLRWNPGTMAELIAIGRELGLQPWLTPWALGGVFGGESASYAVGEHPDECQRGGDDRPLPALCPRQPAFRTLVAAWLDAAATMGAEVVQWDEPHLALPHRVGSERWACRCAACQAAFAERFGAPMPRTVTPEVERFLDDLLFETLDWLVAAARERGLVSSIVLLPEGYDAGRWHAAAALPGVGYFGCTPYGLLYGIRPEAMAGYVSEWAARTVAATAGTDAAALGWVQAFAVPAGREGEIEQATTALTDAAVRVVAVWAYLACAAMSGLAAEDAQAAWAAVRRGFQWAQGRTEPRG